MSLRSPLPKWMGICLIVLTLGMFAFTVSAAITTYTLVKPYVVGISVVESDLKIEALDFGTYYDPLNNKWTSVKVTVKNYASAAKTGTVYCYLYDATGSSVASGSLTTGSVTAGTSVDVVVALTWVSGKTVADVASGSKATVVQSP